MHAFITSLRQCDNIKVIKLNLFFLNFTFFLLTFLQLPSFVLISLDLDPKKEIIFFLSKYLGPIILVPWIFFSSFFHSTVRRIWPSIVRILSLPLTLTILFCFHVFLSSNFSVFLSVFLSFCLSVFLFSCLSVFLL